MHTEPTPRRGRPRIITRETIADAGRRLTLPHVTLEGVARELGVGVRSLYKHTDGIGDIQAITAEAILAAWEAPSPTGELEDHLLEVAVSLRDLALANPGIAGFLVRASEDVSPGVVRTIDAHQQSVARAYGLLPAQASLLLGTVAEHALAVTDVISAQGGRHRDIERMKGRTDLAALSAAARTTGLADPEQHFRFTARALIRGLLELTADMTGQQER